MKARIPVDKKMRKRMEVEAKAICKQELEKQRADIMRRFFKLACYSLNENFGFGHKRLSEFIQDVGMLAIKYDTDEVFWEHLDKVVIDYLKLPFERDYTD